MPEKRRQQLLENMLEYLANFKEVDFKTIGATEETPLQDAYHNCMGYIVELLGADGNKPNFWETTLGFTRKELEDEGMEWLYI